MTLYLHGDWTAHANAVQTPGEPYQKSRNGHWLREYY
jgi:hypothetical protein